MLLPLSLATFRAIEVRAGGRTFLLPTAQVERCVGLEPHQVRAVGLQQTVPLGDQQLPLAALAALLDLPQSPAGRLSCLVLRSGERSVALAVDEVLAEQEVLSKPVARGLTTTPMIAGVAAVGAGRAVPILNGAELVRAALREGGRGVVAPVTVRAKAAGRQLLLVEDSITSRTLLRNILEVAGYRVEAAVDGMQALQKLREMPFDAVVSDIEMPNLDGIGLTEGIRADPQLTHLPVVLVTSLGSPADRERGAEAGANAYIVKSSFEQGHLLQALQELV
jgi:two-component system chemotaxis sensor kinase CheA